MVDDGAVDDGVVCDGVVAALLADQFPRWATLPRTPLGGGSDHVLFRVGTTLLARLPRRGDVAAQVEKEQRWLPVLGPHLPVRVPVPVARGRPGPGCPWPWSIHDWVPGRPGDTVGAGRSLADGLGGFVRALRAVDPAGGPVARDGRGAPLAVRDAEVREALAALAGMPELGLDLDAARAVWHDALAAPVHRGEPVWVHGDLLPGNVVVDDEGGLGGVIDFGCLAVGDPACDLMAAWTILPARHREAFRRAAGLGDSAWRRARGWAVSFGLVALPYHRHRTPGLAAVAERAIREASRA